MAVSSLTRIVSVLHGERRLERHFREAPSSTHDRAGAAELRIHGAEDDAHRAFARKP